MTDNFRDKVYGCIFGCAVGDAMGIGTEFMTLPEIAHYYPEGLSDYSQIIRDAHRSQWPRASWTNDTEILLVQLKAIAETSSAEAEVVAKALKEWYTDDIHDLNSQIRNILSNRDYLSDPYQTARETCIRMGGVKASNEAIPRIAVIGFWNDNPTETAVANSELTNPDPVCSECARLVAKAINIMAYENRVPEPKELSEMMKKSDSRIRTGLDMAEQGKLRAMKLDDETRLWHVIKATSSAFWALWHCSSVMEGILAITAEGGDADTNAALAGSLLGAKYGFASIPSHYIDSLRRPEMLQDAAEKFADLLELKFRS